MPYIKQEFRPAIEEKAKALIESINCAGDMNFAFTVIAREFAKKKKISYATFNEIVGAFECCKLELYRRAIAPYEDKKIEENGDVFDN